MQLPRIIRPVLVLVLVLLSLVLPGLVLSGVESVLPGLAGRAHAQTSFDRPGSDYDTVIIKSGDPNDCAMRCERDRKCRAWTFSYPTETGGTAMCRLKDAVPTPVRSNCCVSGVRGAGVVERRSGDVEQSTDRYGGDYRSFEVKSEDRRPATAEACKLACEADSKCRAYTFARAGYVSRTAQCYLKNELKPPNRRPGLTSGVVR